MHRSFQTGNLGNQDALFSIYVLWAWVSDLNGVCCSLTFFSIPLPLSFMALSLAWRDSRLGHGTDLIRLYLLSLWPHQSVPKATRLLECQCWRERWGTWTQCETAAGPICHRTALQRTVWIWLREFPLFWWFCNWDVMNFPHRFTRRFAQNISAKLVNIHK